MWAKVLNNVRVKNGAFVGIIKGNYYINEDGDIQKISCNSQVLIAEYMILANTVVAQWLTEKSLISLYRNHSPQGGDLPQDINWLELESEDRRNFRISYSHCLARAMYEPTCQGHFALANPHYLHFTSPLRRLADFIVHRIVKAELAGQESPYTEDEINDLADSINEFNLEQKQNKSNYLKEKRDKTILRTTDYSTLETKDFSRLIQLSINNNSLSEIRQELEIRLKARQLTNTDLSWILFKTEDKALHQLIIDHLDDNIIVNLLDNCPNVIDEINHLEYQELISDLTRQIFVGRVVITLNEEQLTTSDAIKGKSKKDAKTQSYKALLQAYVNQELVSPSEVPNPSNKVTEVIPEVPEVIELKHEIPISTLNNLCQQKKWKKPKLNYEQQNEVFICTATLQTEEETITKVGKATKKKMAQNLAFDLILVELEAFN